MIKLKELITENTKTIKVLVKNKNLGDQNISFLVFIQSEVFVFLPKSSKDLDKIINVEHENVIDSIISYLKKHTKLDFEWSTSYNSSGAGYGFEMNHNKILGMLK